MPAERASEPYLGIVRLVRPFGADRLEAAATRAIEIGTLTYGSVRSILDNTRSPGAPQLLGRAIDQPGDFAINLGQILVAKPVPSGVVCTVRCLRSPPGGLSDILTCSG